MRCFAFTDQGLRIAFSSAPCLMVSGLEVPPEDGGPILNYASYVDYLREKRGVDTEYFRQSKRLWLICKKFVVDYLAYYYASSQAVLEDVELRAMLRQYFNQLEFVATGQVYFAPRQR